MNEEELIFKTPIKRMKFSPNLKIILIGTLIFLLMIPFTMINSLIDEREERQNNIIDEISQKWGLSQTISGPILTIPYNTYKFVDGEKKFLQKQFAVFLPENLSITGNINPEIRSRGIYEAIMYNTELNISGFFNSPSFKQWHTEEKDICWNEAVIIFGISDLRGIKDKVQFKWNDSSINLIPGTTINQIHEGIHSPIKLSPKVDSTKKYTFSAKLNINGSKSLNFIPLGKETHVDISSSWHSPTFQGNYLPEKREISQDGFNAKWKILHFNRNFPQQWNSYDFDIYKSTFGVKLIQPIDEYCKIDRTTKYALLFITLTFLTFFLIEILNKLRVHPIQYLLIGFALCLFYTLLLSFTEHFSFNLAYILASAAIIGLITLYTKSVLRQSKLSIIIGLLISVLYGFLYVVLQLQDYSLLMGSIGLFIILSIVMFVTRKIDWYSISTQNKNS